MKKILLPAIFLISLASCDSDEISPIGPAVAQGDEVSFTIKEDRKSRTMYSDDWDPNADGQALYWGNYLEIIEQGIKTNSDKVRIYCNDAAVKTAEYEVTAQDQNNSAAATIVKTGTAGIQWGAENVTHDFYAFYPSAKAGESLVGGSASSIEAEVTPGQAPVTYRSVVGSSATVITDNALQTIANTSYKGDDPGKKIVTYGQPDMSAALMVAHTEVAPADYGKPVVLRFNVIADVLDITVNGPITPNNLLGGNEGADNSTDYIQIHSVTVSSTPANGSSPVAIAGKFVLDMKSKKATQITNGSTSIQLQTAQVSNNATYYPTLWTRSTDKSAFDQLRVRAFLIPGQVESLGDLTVTVSTNHGEYTQQLTKESGSFVSGQIHSIKLKYFDYPGKSFQFNKWIEQLDPNIYVTELSIPGSWMSYSAKAGSVKYQDKTIAEQLAAGIRAFQFHVAVAAVGRTNTSTGWVPSYEYTYSAPYINNTYSGDYGSITGTGNLTYTSVTLESVLNEIGRYIQGTKEFAIVNIGMQGNRPYYKGLTALGDAPGESTLQGQWLPAVAKVIDANTYVYSTEITANTTIEDVRGKVIIKINTNENENEDSSVSCHALFSRWENGNLPAVSTSALQWGSWVDPTVTTDLKWCFVEDAQVGTIGHVSLANLKLGVQNMADASYANYVGGGHNTWYYCAIGGYLSNESTAGAQNLAKEMNPFTLEQLSLPTRQACPMGQILMNYAGSEEYNSTQLIRTIINNNAAFILDKKGATTPLTDVTDNTNSNFSSNSGNSFE